MLTWNCDDDAWSIDKYSSVPFSLGKGAQKKTEKKLTNVSLYVCIRVFYKNTFLKKIMAEPTTYQP